MNSILIIAHAPLASALRSAALHVFPDAAARITAIDVSPLESPEQTLATAQLLLRADTHKNGFVAQDSSASIFGTLVMSDVVGATPCNVAEKLVQGTHTQCLAGASLPMLLRAISYWHEPLAGMAAKALAGGTQGAVVVGTAA